MDFSNYQCEVFDQQGILQKTVDIPKDYGKPMSVSENGQIFLFSQTVEDEETNRLVNEITIVVLIIHINDIRM